MLSLALRNFAIVSDIEYILDICFRVLDIYLLFNRHYSVSVIIKGITKAK